MKLILLLLSGDVARQDGERLVATRLEKRIRNLSLSPGGECAEGSGIEGNGTGLSSGNYRVRKTQPA